MGASGGCVRWVSEAATNGKVDVIKERNLKHFTFTTYIGKRRGGMVVRDRVPQAPGGYPHPLLPHLP